MTIFENIIRPKLCAFSALMISAFSTTMYGASRYRSIAVLDESHARPYPIKHKNRLLFVKHSLIDLGLDV